MIHVNFNKLNKALCLMALFSPIATLKEGSRCTVHPHILKKPCEVGSKEDSNQPWLSEGTMCSGLPGTVLVFASGPNIIINRTPFYSQYCPSLDNKLESYLILGEKFFCLLVNSTVKHLHQSHGVEQVATRVSFNKIFPICMLEHQKE